MPKEKQEEELKSIELPLLFPYKSYRKIQKAFIAQIKSAIENKQRLIVHAPTGSGKTASVLAPSLPYALKEKKTIFFLTSKNTQHIIVNETLKQIKEKYHVPLHAVDLVGKKWMCSQKGVALLNSSEFNEYCREMRKRDMCIHYSNTKSRHSFSPKAQKVARELKEVSPVSVEEVNSICFEADLCPYEISCLMAKSASIIIADYNYLLSPNIRSSFLQRTGLRLEDIILIVDEAHNLPERARKLLSDKLTSFVIVQAAKECKALGYKEAASQTLLLNELLAGIAQEIIAKNKEEAILAKDKLIKGIQANIDYNEFMKVLSGVGEDILLEKRRSFANSLACFLASWLGPDEGFVRILSREKSASGKEYLSVKYNCLDPSLSIKSVASPCHSFIAMSGTLTPSFMYKDLFGFDSGTILVEYENPFPKSNRLSLIVPVTSTKFTTRSPAMYKRISGHCASIIENIPGNCAAFFPSYNIRDMVYASLKNLCAKTVFLESPSMSKSEKVSLLEDFKSYKDKGALLLCASSGNYGESIDLIGDLLNGVIVVGLPLKRPDLETQEIIKYYDKKFEKGWDYGYVMPAIIKAIQNAGRCIRSETDRGAVVFLDERYVWPTYKSCFPKDWNFQITKEPAELIKKFFAEKQAEKK